MCRFFTGEPTIFLFLSLGGHKNKQPVHPHIKPMYSLPKEIHR
jgi:hypothetical protein